MDLHLISTKQICLAVNIFYRPILINVSLSTFYICLDKSIFMYQTKVKVDETRNATAIKCHLNSHKEITMQIELYMERENEEKVLEFVFVFQYSVKEDLF